MATYTVSRRDDHSGFAVQIIGDDGARQTMLGFEFRADALAWIAEDRKTTNVVETGVVIPAHDGSRPTSSG